MTSPVTDEDRQAAIAELRAAERAYEPYRAILDFARARYTSVERAYWRPRHGWRREESDGSLECYKCDAVLSMDEDKGPRLTEMCPKGTP